MMIFLPVRSVIHRCCRLLLIALALAPLGSGCSVKGQQSRPNRAEAAQARAHLGLAYLEQGKLPLARQNLEQALQHQPKNSQVLRAMAYYQQQVGEPQFAQAYYQRALQQTPRDGQLLHQYADFLCQQCCYPEAQRYFTAALQAPGYAQVAETLRQSGFCYLLAGNSEAAKGRLQRALRHHPGQGSEWVRWGHQAVDKGELQQASGLLAIYQALQPNTPESLHLQQRLSALQTIPRVAEP